MRVLAASPIVALVAATLLLLGGARPASAHALYEKSQPASGAQLEAPGQIQVSFTEAVERSFSTLEVLDSTRQRVDLDDSHAIPDSDKALVVSVPALPDGTYTVSWRALSAVDGHVTRGVFPLVVGVGGATGALEEAPAYVPQPIDVAVRWLAYLAMLAIGGGFLFRTAILSRAVNTAGWGRERQGEVLAAYEQRFRSIGIKISAVLLLCSVVGMASQAANAADVSILAAFGEPLTRLLPTRLGLLWQVRLAATIVVAALLWKAHGRAAWWLGLTFSGVLLATVSLNSHAAAIPSGTWLAVALDWLHQVAAAAWVGGLFSFALVLPAAIRQLRAVGRIRLLAAIIPRFSILAIVSVVVLALTGTFQSWIQVGAWSAFGTLYGTSLIVKLVLLVPMLGIGAANLFIARPRLAAATATGGRRVGSGLSQLTQRFRWAIVAEAALGVGVLLATALLTASEPARETYARQPRPITLTGMAEDVGVDLRISPARPGPNTFVVTLDDGGGQPAAEVQRVTLRFTYLDQDLGSGNLVLEPRDDGTYGAVASNLSTDGTWQIETLVRRRGRDDSRVGFRTQVASAKTAGQPPSLEAFSLSGVAPRQVMAVGFIVIGMGLAYWISRSRDVRRTERLALYAASFAIAMIGGVLYTRALAAPALPVDVRTLRNPYPPDATSLTRGKQVYDQLCASCHGVTGRGDGPVAPTLRPRPADFRVHMAAGHTDGELFTWLTKGVPGTSMPAFEGQLSEEDRWHAINYIRGFAPETE